MCGETLSVAISQPSKLSLLLEFVLGKTTLKDAI